jgi:hypothetical protein
MRAELTAPACFVEITSFDMGTDPGAEELAVATNFEALIVMRTSYGTSVGLTSYALAKISGKHAESYRIRSSSTGRS